MDAYGAALEARYGATLRLVEERPGGRLWLTADGAVLLGGNGADTLLAFAPTPGEALLACTPAGPPVESLVSAGG